MIFKELDLVSIPTRLFPLFVMSDVDELHERLREALAARQEAETQCVQLAADLADFKEMSRELEHELERELDERDWKQRQLEARTESLERELQKWRAKYTELVAISSDERAKLAAQLETLNAERRRDAERLRNVEIEHDDMERNERIVKSSFQILEERNAELLEQLALAESERAERDVLSEELQRAKDLIRDLEDERSRTLSTAQDETHISGGRMVTSRSLQRINRIIGHATNIESRLANVRRRFSGFSSSTKAQPRPAPLLHGCGHGRPL